jgi:hypothetical protein
MALMLHDVGMHPDAHIAIMAANEANAHLAIDFAIHEPIEAESDRRLNIERAVAGTGQVAAIMTDARNAATVEEQVAADEDFNATLDQVNAWTGVAFSIAEAPLAERFPVAGTAVTEIRGVISDAVFSSLEQNDEAAAQSQASSRREETLAQYRDITMVEAVDAAIERRDPRFIIGDPQDLRDGASTGFASSFADGRTREPE